MCIGSCRLVSHAFGGVGWCDVHWLPSARVMCIAHVSSCDVRRLVWHARSLRCTHGFVCCALDEIFSPHHTSFALAARLASFARSIRADLHPFFGVRCSRCSTLSLHVLCVAPRAMRGTSFPRMGQFPRAMCGDFHVSVALLVFSATSLVRYSCRATYLSLKPGFNCACKMR